MPMPTGRSEKRTPIELAVVLCDVSERPFKERTLTENMSSHGLRAVTKRSWPVGDQLQVSFAAQSAPGLARIVYCQRLSKERFAVGLALSATLQQSAD